MSLLKEIHKSLFGEQPKDVEMAEARLENGETIVAESFEAGNPVFLRTEDGDIPLPEGEYALEDGSRSVVSAEGVIAEYAPAAETEQASEKEEMSKEEPKEEFLTKSEFEAWAEGFTSEILKGFELVKPKEEHKSEDLKKEVELKAEVELLKKELHKKRNLNKKEEVDESKPKLKERNVRHKFVDPTRARVQANNEKFITNAE